MKGETQEMSERAERFSRQLEGRYGIPTEMIDERLTTREAWHRDGNRQQRLVSVENPGYEIDSLSAVLITESWLREFAATRLTIVLFSQSICAIKRPHKPAEPK